MIITPISQRLYCLHKLVSFSGSLRVLLCGVFLLSNQPLPGTSLSLDGFSLTLFAENNSNLH